MNLGEEIKKKIKREGMTINSWSIKYGISPQKVHDWIEGAKPIISPALRLSKALGVSVKRLEEIICENDKDTRR